MAIGVPDNFNYGGKKPNFVRDQFETIKAMNEYPADYIDEGHISYCKEDKKHYKWNGSSWEELQVPSSGGGGTAGMAISGTFNVATSTASQYSSIFSSMSVGDMRMYLVTDSNGNLPSTSETAVTVTYDGFLSPAFLYFGKSDNFGVSVGDILVFAKLNALTNVCRIIPLNDVKAANGDFPGADGLSTPWDKSRINKVDGIEWTANNNRDRLNALIPSVWKDNMNECLDTGVYPWCGTGRPVGSADGTHFTCVTIKSTTPDSSGYYTYWQTCFGREGADIGKAYQRVFFLGNGVEDNWGEGWKRVDNISLMSQLIDDVGYAKQSSVDRLSTSKVDRTDNAPELTVGFANNLVGRGEATEETIVFRASGGDTSIEDGTARIERLKGNTVVWNQLVSGDGEITLLSNRKYLVNGSFNAPTEDTLLAVTSTDVVYDLSLMFGASNEPTTIEEFNARKPIGIDEYAYNDGELISTNVDEVKSIGFNLLDVSTMQPNRMMPNGNVYDDTSVVHSDYVKVLPSSKYFTNMYCKKNVYTLIWLDEDKAVISSALGSIVSNTGKSVTSPSNAAYVVINLPSAKYDSSNFVFHLEHTGYRNGEYEPYKEFRRSLPISEIKDSEGNALFPNGLLSAGSVFDEITATKAIKRIGERAYQDGDTWTDGVTTYYELAEPIEVDLPESLNLDYEVSDFGTEEIIYDTPTTPLNADIIYQFNAVDRIRENSVSIEHLIKRVAELEAANAALVQQLSTNE
jgi:hypothetical protein